MLGLYGEGALHCLKGSTPASWTSYIPRPSGHIVPPVILCIPIPLAFAISILPMPQGYRGRVTRPGHTYSRERAQAEGTTCTACDNTRFLVDGSCVKSTECRGSVMYRKGQKLLNEPCSCKGAGVSGCQACLMTKAGTETQCVAALLVAACYVCPPPSWCCCPQVDSCHVFFPLRGKPPLLSQPLVDRRFTRGCSLVHHPPWHLLPS